jgi:uncharacterized protein YbaR (Trm112 family)
VRAWLAQTGFKLQRQLTVSHYRMDLFKRLLPTRLLVGMDALAQLTGDWWQLSPSVFTRSLAVGETPPAAPGAFFRCPACGAGMTEWQHDGALACPGCGKAYPVRDGIFDFRE